MSETTFKTLSTLVKNNLIHTFQVPEIDENIDKLTQESDLLKSAGFSSKASEVDYSREQIKKEWLLQNELKHWREQGYLVIQIKDFKKTWDWKHRINDQCWVKEIVEGTTIKIRTFFGEKLVPFWFCKKIIALVNTEEYLANVPNNILVKAAEFREKALQMRAGDYPAIQTFILTVTTPDLLNSIVRLRPSDPLLLYRPYYDGDYKNHLGLDGNFVVVAWWGADIEDIEAELGLSRSEFPATSIIEAIKRIPAGGESTVNSQGSEEAKLRTDQK